MINAFTMLNALQAFLEKRSVDVNTVRADDMVTLMHGLLIKSFQRLLGKLAGAVARQNVEQAQWTGQENGINALEQRRVALLPLGQRQDVAVAHVEWLSGITLMFEPAGYAHLKSMSIASSESASIESFMRTVQQSPAYQACVYVTPVAVLVESGGVR